MASKNLVIIGGGFAGVYTANYLHRRLPQGWRIILFSQENHFIFGAVGMGMRDTHRSIMNVFSNLRGLVLGRLPVEKNLGGPARIGEMAYRIAGFDFWEFVFFLGLISINLAVVNFLPIPVLDGGHMVFLIYEKLRGKPASEGVRVGATYAGLAIILCLMGFVIFLDITHYLR